MNTPPASIGLIGLGNAGAALAMGLVRSGLHVTGFDLSPAQRKLAQESGVRIAESIAAIARTTQVILLCLPTPAASRNVMESLCEHPLQGRLIIETSTVSHQDIDWLCQMAERHGASAMDAAIIGGISNLSQCQATFLVGAHAADYAVAEPILGRIAQKIWHLGTPGTGMKMKVINNAIAHTTMVMLMEGLSMAVKCGIEPQQFCELLACESGLTRPLTHRIAQRVMSEDYSGGMSTRNARKDSVLAQELAASLGIPLFTMSTSHSIYEIACTMPDLRENDYASIARLWEKWANIRFAG